MLAVQTGAGMERPALAPPPRDEIAALKSRCAELETFAAGAAHDMKAPLRNITSLLGFLDEDFGHMLAPEALELVRQSRRAARQAQHLVRDLLDHASSGGIDLVPVNCDLSQEVDAVLEDLSPHIERAGGTVEMMGDLGTVAADRTLLRRLLANVILNAMTYRDPDRAPHLRISRRGERLRFRDNGRGFDPAMREAVFVAFKRLEPSGDIEGTGIGLATCRRICERHGWSISAEAAPGIGAVFEVVGLS